MNVIDLESMPVGAAIEIIQADILPVLQTETAYKYLCLDEQERLVTTAKSSRLLGGASVAELKESLKTLGYMPFFTN